ncbi:MAG: ABC transporter ATP-binding protein [Desulfobacula sp.]|nr:ABC transporter ATP-binding protein [Desulfobacula sp.]
MQEITLKNISKTFVSEFKRQKKKAVDDLSLSIPTAEIFGIIGVNGAGKSTTIKMILGFIRPDKGQIFVAGRDPSDPDSRLKVGYLPENPYFYDNLSARELLTFSTRTSGLGKKESNERIDLLLEKLGLTDVQHHKLRTYSKGMTQRAGICFSLVHDPDIIILDEPMSGLDPFGRRMVIDLIEHLKAQGKTVLFCSHILNDVERICDRVGIMDKGQLKKVLTREQIHQGTNKSIDYTINNMEEIFLQTICGKK